MDEHIDRTSEGIPVGTSREEERLDEIGIKPSDSVERAKQRSDAASDDRGEEDIPLSEKTGEGRLDKPR